MKKTIITVIVLVLIGVLAYVAVTFGKKEDPKVAVDPCAVDLRAAYLTDAPFSMTEKEVATTILTQYLEALKELEGCPAYQILDYNITTVDNIREVGGDFMTDVKFDFKPTDLTSNKFGSDETKIDGEWIRNKQATLGIVRAPGTGTTTVSYGLAI